LTIYLFEKMLASTGRFPSRPGGTSIRRNITRNVSETGQRKIAMSDASSKVSEIDVRSLVPAQRHAKIFQLVGELSPGSSFVLVNDHDPKPLYYHRRPSRGPISNADRRSGRSRSAGWRRLPESRPDASSDATA